VLLAIPLCGLSIFGLAAYNTLRTLSINGPVYRKVAEGKDLIAEALPPPQFIVEACLAVFQAIGKIDNPDVYRDFVRENQRLEAEFEARQLIWARRLPPGDLRKALVEDAGGAARAFFQSVKQRFLPALAQGDRIEALRLAHGPLADAYERHRRAIGQVVALAAAQNLILEHQAQSTRIKWSGLMLLIGVGTLFLTATTGLLVAGAVLRPIRNLDQAILAQLHGEPGFRVEKVGQDELGRLGDSFNAMARAIEARTAALGESNLELQRANRELESFSYSVSHDLRAPLRAILGFSRVLEEDFGPALPDEARRYVGIINANTRRMGQLIDDLLAFARHLRRPLNRQVVPMDALVRSCLEELDIDLRGRNVDLRIAPLSTCEADPALTKQVFLNLLSNAFKFTRKRDPAVVEVWSEHRQGQTVYVVKDNGVGFDMRYADKVFAVFQRLHPDDAYEGTGIGLALVERIVSRHGGRVWADASPDVGAQFSLTFEGTVAP
jgi:signal transduction histidine kinase